MTLDFKLMNAMKYCAHILRHHCIYNESQNRIVMLVDKYGPISQKDLLGKMNMQPGSLSELVSKVEAAGLIEKKQSKTDKRIHLLHITTQGKAQSLEYEKQQEEMTEKLFAVLEPEQKEILLQNLDTLLQHWETMKNKE